ncbi:MAG: sulfite exporter TauE/SafE family protein [Acetobacteraceae bacterium]|nr:sulfite exporter TauE/SafE family protein [Acetobacteraceae bacterium]
METLANCLHDLTTLGAAGTLALAGALFLAGLAGSATHCVGMCGPFVLGQVTAGLAARPTLSRLAAGALLPYHLGRLVTYTGLGAAAGLVAGLAAHGAGLRVALPLLLGLGALLMLAQAFGQAAPSLSRLGFSLPAGFAAAVTRRAAPFLSDPRGARGFVLGLLLGFLPCGLLYGALAAAAAAGSALGGALAMAAFAAGTVPALVGVGLAGAFFGRRFAPALRLVAVPLLLLNATVLAALALRAAGIA